MSHYLVPQRWNERRQTARGGDHLRVGHGHTRRSSALCVFGIHPLTDRGVSSDFDRFAPCEDRGSGGGRCAATIVFGRCGRDPTGRRISSVSGTITSSMTATPPVRGVTLLGNPRPPVDRRRYRRRVSFGAATMDGRADPRRWIVAPGIPLPAPLGTRQYAPLLALLAYGCKQSYR